MVHDVRFTVRPQAENAGLLYVLQVRKSCTAVLAEDWLAKRGIKVTFKRRGWWYEASWGDSPAAQAIAPLLQARADR